MFYIVNTVDGAGLFEYHYSLAVGMLESSTFLVFVFFLWFLYARKCVAFVSGAMRTPAYAFLHIYRCLDKLERFKLFLWVEVWLLLPILLYALFVIVVGWQRHLYGQALLVAVYLLFLCIISAVWHVYVLKNLNNEGAFKWIVSNRRFRWPSSYPLILIRFVLNRQKFMWLGLKVFTCGILYKIAQNNTTADYDSSFPFLFFNFGILANGTIVYRIREFEETHLGFYRQVPVSLLKRLMGYAFVYLILLVPELITIGMLVPIRLLYSDAINFSLCGYGLLLLMNSITFFRHLRMKEFLKIVLLVFCLQYIFLLTVGLTVLSVCFFTLAIAAFLATYYRFERFMDASASGDTK